MFRLPHRLLTLLARFVNMLWASHSRRCVLSAVRGWYAKRWQAQSWFPATCWRIFVFESTGFRRAQKPGSSVSACKVTCQGARPAMKASTFIRVEWVVSGTAAEAPEQTNPSSRWHTTWPRYHFICILPLSCSSPCSLLHSVFYYCMALPHRKSFTS